MNMFEMATRNKFRCPYKGLVCVEDLWDLNETQLDGVYKALMKDSKMSNEDSLISSNSIENIELKTKIDIVKFIFDAKKADERARKASAENAAKKRHILDILAQKQEASLFNKSEEELLDILKTLED